MSKTRRVKINPRNCIHCGHPRRWHVTVPDHQRHGDCEYPMGSGLCRCPGYEEAPDAIKVKAIRGDNSPEGEERLSQLVSFLLHGDSPTEESK